VDLGFAVGPNERVLSATSPDCTDETRSDVWWIAEFPSSTDPSMRLGVDASAFFAANGAGLANGLSTSSDVTNCMCDGTGGGCDQRGACGFTANAVLSSNHRCDPGGPPDEDQVAALTALYGARP
jgi:hypothetical protein